MAVPARANFAALRGSRGARVQRRGRGPTRARAFGPTDADEIEMLEIMLAKAKERKEAEDAPPMAAAAGDYTGPAFNVLTFNAISPVGLSRFPAGRYAVSDDTDALEGDPMAIMLRSHQLQEAEVAPSTRCIARCGAGTNNIPVARMTELGIPVFNTPGANANAVKELTVCALLLASRGIAEGISHVSNVIAPEEAHEHERIAKRIEKDKSMFVGHEIEGRTLGVIGLGQIGSRVVDAALGLGMKVVGYDPALSLESAWRLPGDRMTRATSLDELLKASDYITLHVPYIKGVTHHLINAEALSKCKPNVSILNFARGEIVDGEALAKCYQSGRITGKYVSDFSDPALNGHPLHLVMPHLGASTGEAEENSAAMAADTIMSFLETGTIRNSVNFPTTVPAPIQGYARLCIVHKNIPGVLGTITTFLGGKNINITQQINNSAGDVAYTVIDMQDQPAEPDELQTELAKTCEGIISSRFIGSIFADQMGTPGTFFYVSWA